MAETNKPTIADIERQLAIQVQISGCCNFGAAYLAAGGKIPKEVCENIEKMNPLFQLLAKRSQKMPHPKGTKKGTRKGGKGGGY